MIFAQAIVRRSSRWRRNFNNASLLYESPCLAAGAPHAEIVLLQEVIITPCKSGIDWLAVIYRISVKPLRYGHASSRHGGYAAGVIAIYYIGFIAAEGRLLGVKVRGGGNGRRLSFEDDTALLHHHQSCSSQSMALHGLRPNRRLNTFPLQNMKCAYRHDDNRRAHGIEFTIAPDDGNQ